MRPPQKPFTALLLQTLSQLERQNGKYMRNNKPVKRANRGLMVCEDYRGLERAFGGFKSQTFWHEILVWKA